MRLQLIWVAVAVFAWSPELALGSRAEVPLRRRSTLRGQPSPLHPHVAAVYSLVQEAETAARAGGFQFPNLLLETTRKRLAHHASVTSGDVDAELADSVEETAIKMAEAAKYDVGDDVVDIPVEDGGDNDKCARVCKCLASEFLYGVTKGVLPYSPNAAGGTIFTYASVPNTTPLWYKKEENKWKWTPYNPDEDDVSDRWTDCDAPGDDKFDVNGGLWSFAQNIGLTDVADTNKVLIRVLGAINPDGGTSGAPDGSDANKADAKSDLQLCAARSQLDPVERCECRKSACIKSLVPKYFKYLQLVEKAAAHHANTKALTNWALDAVSIGLDLLGLIDPLGPVFDIANAALAFGRGLWMDGVLGLICVVPAFGSPFLALKWVNKGIITATGKLADLWAYIKIAFSKSDVLLKNFADEITAAAKSGAGALDKLKSFGAGLKRIGSTFWYMLKEGKVAADEVKDLAVKAATDKSALKKVRQTVGEFTKELLKRIGCGSAAGWVITIFEKIGLALEYFDKFKVVGEWVQAISPCLEACAKGESARDRLRSIEECAAEVASETAKKLNPCWEEKGPDGSDPISADPAFALDLRPTPEEIEETDQIVQGALDTYACECAVEAEVPVKMSGGDRGMPSDDDMSEPSDLAKEIVSKKKQTPGDKKKHGSIARFALKLAGEDPDGEAAGCTQTASPDGASQTSNSAPALESSGNAAENFHSTGELSRDNAPRTPLGVTQSRLAREGDELEAAVSSASATSTAHPASVTSADDGSVANQFHASGTSLQDNSPHTAAHSSTPRAPLQETQQRLLHQGEAVESYYQERARRAEAGEVDAPETQPDMFKVRAV